MKTIENDALKFRVFIPVENRYMDNKIDNPIIDSSGNLMWCYLDKIGNLKRYEHNLLNREQAIIERCTGLRDKNGKLIHENDVVRFYWTEQAPQEFVVKWNNRRCCFDFNVYKKHKRGCKFEQWYWCFDSGECKYCEIIGTIHDDKFRDNTKLIEENE